jgi:hypothetical protein
MDVGVGSFVLVNSLTAGNSLVVARAQQPFRHALRAAVPLALLGLGRLASVKAAETQGRDDRVCLGGKRCSSFRVSVSVCACVCVCVEVCAGGLGLTCGCTCRSM